MSAKPSFFAELQRRHVYKVGAAYAVAAWLLAQVATQVLPVFEVGEAAQRIILLLLIAGFPLALILAWLFDLTPQGIVRTTDAADHGETANAVKVRRGADHRLNYMLGGLLALALAFLLAERTVLKPAASRFAAKPGHSIAVLPFENLSDDKANAYFAQGIQDEILTRLSKLGALRVISRTSTASLDSKPGNLAEIAGRLGVDTFLEGSVQKSGDVTRINVQLIRAATDDHLWAETYDRKLDNVFSVEGEVAQAIADALNAQLTGDEHRALDAAPTRNAQAYDAYLRGIADDLRFSLPGYLDAEKAYEAAVQADPEFALAWAHLSITRSFLYLNGHGHDAQGLARLRESADTAMRLQPQLGEAWLARGYYFYRGLSDFDSALAAFEEASRRLPNNAEVSAAIAYVLRRQGKLDEVVARLQTAARRDPQNTSYWSSIAETEAARRRYAEAQTALDRALVIEPARVGLLMQKVRLLQQQGKLDAAQTIIDTLQSGADTPEVISTTATQLFYRHRYDSLTSLLEGFLAQPGFDLGDNGPGLYSLLGAAKLYGGDQRGAQAAFETGKQIALGLRRKGVDTANLACNLGVIEAGLGERDAALAEGRHCLQLSAGDQWQNASAQATQATIDVLIGEPETALAALPKLLQTPNGADFGDLRYSPVWDPLRGNPKFETLLAAATPR